MFNQIQVVMLVAMTDNLNPDVVNLPEIPSFSMYA